MPCQKPLTRIFYSFIYFHRSRETANIPRPLHFYSQFSSLISTYTYDIHHQQYVCSVRLILSLLKLHRHVHFRNDYDDDKLLQTRQCKKYGSLYIMYRTEAFVRVFDMKKVLCQRENYAILTNARWSSLPAFYTYSRTYLYGTIVHQNSFSMGKVCTQFFSFCLCSSLCVFSFFLPQLFCCCYCCRYRACK